MKNPAALETQALHEKRAGLRYGFDEEIDRNVQ